MKKVFLSIALLAVVSCDTTPKDQGSDNACQFIREQIASQSENIERIEVIGADTLLSDAGIGFGMSRLHDTEMRYISEEIPASELDRVADSLDAELMFVEQSWVYGTVAKTVKKYEGQWRKVYTIRVTTKSGVTKEPRVLMDADGTTPRMLEMDFFEEIRKHKMDILYLRSRRGI